MNWRQFNIITILKKYCKWNKIPENLILPDNKQAAYEKEEDLKLEIAALILWWLWGEKIVEASPSNASPTNWYEAETEDVPDPSPFKLIEI